MSVPSLRDLSHSPSLISLTHSEGDGPLYAISNLNLKNRLSTSISSWFQRHLPKENEFYSGSSSFPLVNDGLVPSSPQSEADISHSMASKRILRYNRGIPISPPSPGHAMRKQGLKKVYYLSPQTSPSSILRIVSISKPPVFNPSSSQEEIRNLPSYGEVPISSRPSHVRSKSLPRSLLRQHLLAPDVPFIPPPRLQTRSLYHCKNSLAIRAISPTISPTDQLNLAQPTHPWPPRHGHPKLTPPAIVYAPSHRSHQPHDAPPAMFHHPPRMGPNGMIYSHSATVPGQYCNYSTILGGSSRHQSFSAHDFRGPGGPDLSHTRSLGRSTRINSASSSSLPSYNSGSTYYILPQGQEVHAIVSS